ncbi:MAG: hypothetical protein U1F10_04200 [Burkholderiales bacterium]
MLALTGARASAGRRAGERRHPRAALGRRRRPASSRSPTSALARIVSSLADHAPVRRHGRRHAGPAGGARRHRQGELALAFAGTVAGRRVVLEQARLAGGGKVEGSGTFAFDAPRAFTVKATATLRSVALRRSPARPSTVPSTPATPRRRAST